MVFIFIAKALTIVLDLATKMAATVGRGAMTATVRAVSRKKMIPQRAPLVLVNAQFYILTHYIIFDVGKKLKRTVFRRF